MDSRKSKENWELVFEEKEIDGGPFGKYLGTKSVTLQEFRRDSSAGE